MATGVTSSITSNVTFSSRYQLTTEDDTLIIQGAVVTLIAPQGEIFTREGDDTVRVENSTIEATVENLAFYLGDGNDSLSIKNSIISTPVYMGVGNDYVRIEGTIQTSTDLNKKLSFGSGNDTLELIAMLQNTGGIDFGDGRNKLLFNGGALLGAGALGNFTDLEVSLSGGTTGSNLTLSGEQMTVALNGNFFGTTDNNSISASNNSMTLTVGNNVRSNVKFNLNNTTLIQAEGGTLEISEHSGYAFNVNAKSAVTLHDIVTMDGGSISGTGSTMTVTNGDFSNSKIQTNIVLNNNSILTGTALSFAGNQGYGAMLLDKSTVNVSGFRANNNKVFISSIVSSRSYAGGSAFAYASAFGGAICQNDGSMTLTSATFSGNAASAFTTAFLGSSRSDWPPAYVSANASAYASAFGGAICQNGGSMSLTSATFSKNIASAYANAEIDKIYGSSSSYRSAYAHASAYGGAIYQNGGSMTLSNAAFSGNVVSANASASAYWVSGSPYAFISASAYGGAICQSGGNTTLFNAVFSGNTASAYAPGGNISSSTLYGSVYGCVYGGAIILTNTIANYHDAIFQNNTASAYADLPYYGPASVSAHAYGGALYLDKTTLNYSVKAGNTITNKGNKAIATTSSHYGQVKECKDAGGWLYATNASTVNITVGSNATLEIGDSSKYTDRTTEDDSIAGTSDSLITKSGTGIMVVNSDISKYTGKWSVNEGTLQLRRTYQTLNLDDWTIGINGKLVLSGEQDIVNMGMSKKVGLIDFGGGTDADVLNTNGFDLTAGELLIRFITFNGTGRINTRLTNRNSDQGNTINLNGVVLASDFTGNGYADTITVGQESTIDGAIDLAGGNDIITATAKTTFTNTLRTGAGNDTLSFTDAVFEDTVDLGDGTNSLSATGEAKFSCRMTAGSGADTMSFATVTFDDSLNLGNGINTLTASSEARFQDIVGGTGNDTITLNGNSTISGEISLGTGTNSIHVNKKLTAERIRIANGGQTTVYVYYGSMLVGNSLTVYSDEQASREAITLNWSDQPDLDKVRILVSRDRSSFQNDQYDFAVELYNQSKSFTLNLQKGYYIQFQAQDDNGWKQRLLIDTTAPDQVTGLTFDGKILSWDEAQDNPGGNGVKQYHVEVSQDASFPAFGRYTVTETQFSLSSISQESMLYFRVSAEDYTGNIGAFSETVSVLFDTVPPTIPGGAQSAVDGYSAVLSWSASADGGSGVSTYEYRIATDSTYGQIVTSGTTETCSVSIDGLGFGNYSWQVRAVDAAGNTGDWSMSKSFTTVDGVAPGTPTNLDCGVEDAVSVSVIWDGTTDDALGSGLKGYEIQLATDAKFSTVVKTISVTATEVRIDNLATETYYMRVCAVDNAGNKSGWTEAVSFTIDKDTILPTISNIQADVTKPTNGSVTITATFDDNVALASSLYRIGENGQWTDYVDGVTVTENAVVYFKAVDAAGNETETSYTVNNIDKVAPSVPSGLMAVVSEQTVVLIWSPSTDSASGIGEYVVKYSSNGQEFSVAVNNTNYMLTDLSSGTWSWSVQAVDAVGNVSEAAPGNEFTVKQSVEPEPQKLFVAGSDIDGNGISDVMFVWTGEHGEGNYQHGYWMNGTDDWQSAGVRHPSDWDNLGCYDMTGDGKADSVLFGNVNEDGIRGAYIGYYADGVDLDDNWVTIGYLDSIEVDWKNKVGNLTGNEKGANSIVWYAPEMYALGAWKDGKEDWVFISDSFGGDAWTLVGCGDFDGDGRDSIMMAYNGGQRFFTADIDGTVTVMGDASWSGWEVRAIGDFKGDGKDDLVLFHKETGSMVMIADGKTDKDNYIDLDQLSVKDWFVVGCGDYDGDQKDDLLVRQYSTGMLGYYSSGDTKQWNVLGYGVSMEWTVIA